VHPGQTDAGVGGEVVQLPGGRVAVHPYVASVAQDRAGLAVVDGAFDRALPGWR
jgi:hypothetical protein